MTTSTITVAEVEYLRKKFNRLTDGHGLTVEVLKQIYETAQIPVSDHDLHAQIRAADLKGHGKLDFDDFLNVMSKQYDINSEEGTTKVFEILDTDKDGLINGEDLKRGIALFGQTITDEEIEEMILSADVDGDNLINYEEFLKVMTPCKINGQSSF